MDEIDRLAVALSIEEKQRLLNGLMEEQRQLIAEMLILCQRYIDLQDKKL